MCLKFNINTGLYCIVKPNDPEIGGLILGSIYDNKDDLEIIKNIYSYSYEYMKRLYFHDDNNTHYHDKETEFINCCNYYDKHQRYKSKYKQ